MNGYVDRRWVFVSLVGISGRVCVGFDLIKPIGIFRGQGLHELIHRGAG